jgi:hypothetical protein
MTVEVFHKKSFEEFVNHPRDFEGVDRMLKAQDSAIFPKDYVHVATVDTDSKEVAFELTNNIDRAWHENHAVTPRFKASGCRSTSVGDVVVCGDEQNKTTYKCARFGWEEIDSGGYTQKNMEVAYG